jgi:hypothetical protein
LHLDVRVFRCQMLFGFCAVFTVFPQGMTFTYASDSGIHLEMENVSTGQIETFFAVVKIRVEIFSILFVSTSLMTKLRCNLFAHISRVVRSYTHMYAMYKTHSCFIPERVPESSQIFIHRDPHSPKNYEKYCRCDRR